MPINRFFKRDIFHSPDRQWVVRIMFQFSQLRNLKMIKVNYSIILLDINKLSRSIENLKEDGRLTPAIFLLHYKVFDRLLQTVKNEKTNCYEHIFQRVSQNNRSTKNFRNFRHHRLIKCPKQRTKLEIFL